MLKCLYFYTKGDDQWVFGKISAVSGYLNFTLPMKYNVSLSAISIAEDATRYNGVAMCAHSITRFTTTSLQTGFGTHDFTHKITGLGGYTVGY